MREFLFGNIQIGVTSQRLLFKASCMELETPHETRYYLHYQEKIQRERERESKKGLMKSHIQTYAAYSSSAWCYSLYLCLSLFLLSLSLLCVYLLSLCVFFLFFILFFACSSPIYRRTKKQFFPILALNSSIQGAVWVSFSSIIPNFMVSLAPLFPLFR